MKHNAERKSTLPWPRISCFRDKGKPLTLNPKHNAEHLIRAPLPRPLIMARCNWANCVQRCQLWHQWHTQGNPSTDVRTWTHVCFLTQVATQVPQGALPPCCFQRCQPSECQVALPVDHVTRVLCWGSHQVLERLRPPPPVLVPAWVELAIPMHHSKRSLLVSCHYMHSLHPLTAHKPGTCSKCTRETPLRMSPTAS